jgi:hypothetical protein
MKTLRERWESIREWWLEFQEIADQPDNPDGQDAASDGKCPKCGRPVQGISVLGIALATVCALTGCTMVNSHDDSDFHETARLWMQSRHTTTKVTTVR